MKVALITIIVILHVLIDQNVAIRRIKRLDKRRAEQASKAVDIGALLESGKPLSIKSTETDTMDENGKTNKRIKELQIGTPGDPTSTSSEEASSVRKENHDSNSEDNNSLHGLVSVINTGLANASLLHINSPLSTSNGAPMSEYPSIHEITKGANGNESAAASDLNNQTAVEETSAVHGTNETLGENSGPETSKLAGNESHVDAVESTIEKVAGSNESQAELQPSVAEDSKLTQDQSHLSKNESSSEEPISNALSAEVSPASNKSSEHASNADTKKIAGGNQIALVPISLPMELISQLQGALKNQSSLSGKSENTTSDSSAAGLESDKTKNETPGLRRDSENSVLPSGKGTGQGVILLANMLNDKPGTKKSETNNAFKKFDIDVTIEEEPDENTGIEEDDDE